MERGGHSKSRDGSQVDPSTGFDSEQYPELIELAIITNLFGYILI